MRKKRWLDLTINILSITLTLMVLLLIVSLILQRCPFLVGADYSFEILGHSMLPVLRTGDMGLVIKGIENIEIGDVIYFKVNSKFFVSRVIDIQIYPNIIFKTKGDNKNYADGWIEANSVVGREIFFIPLGFFMTRNAFFLITGLIILLILLRLFYSLPEKNILARNSQYLLIDLDILFLVIIIAFSLDRLWSL